MGIFSRTRDIIAANVTDLLDKAEDPAKMIRMIILEMEETLVEVRASAARTIADQKEMRRHIAKLEALQANWTEKAELALSKDREDLAKAALVERQKAADMADQLKAEIARARRCAAGSEADIAKLQSKLREARTRQNSVETRLESAEQPLQAARDVCGDRRRRKPSAASTCWSAASTRPRAAPTRWPGRSQDAGGGNRRTAVVRKGRCRARRAQGAPDEGGLSRWKRS